MKSIISSTITRKMTMSIVVLLVGIATFGITAFGMTDKTYATESTLSLSISSSTVQADAAPINANGTFSKATTSTITASTNNATGYTLSIAAPSNAGSDYNKLIHATDSTAKLNSISSPTTEEQYKALNATSYNNTWGYLPSKYCSDGTSSSCSTNISFLPAPTTVGDILDQTTSANSTANTYTIGMGTRIDSTTKIGNYTNSFVVRLVANAIPYSIIYDDNVVSNMPTDVDATTPSSTINIASNTPVRAGFRFLGWCTVAPTSSSDGDTCGGTTHQPNGGITLDQVTPTNNDFHLYAMWKKVYTMQEFAAGTASTTCSAMSTGNTLKLIDSRDSQEYTIGKLADGKCWMLDNLALDVVAKIDDMNETNTNASNTTLGYLKNGGGSTASGDATYKYASAGVANWTTSASYSTPLVNISNKDTVPSNAPADGQGNNKIGGYYNYCAASAGSYCYGSGTSAGTSEDNATEDICPKGWRLPSGSTSGEFGALANQIYGSTGSTSDATNVANYRNALSLPLSGYFNNGSPYYQGSYGNWWSSTRSNNYSMYDLYARTSLIYPAYSYDRYYGYSIRCVLGS